MTLVLLTRGPESRFLEVRRSGGWARLRAQARAFKLDRALAGGTRPDAGPSLGLRAHALISAIHRRQLAGELRRVTCGVAHLEILLRDGVGHLYGKTATTRLRQALREIIHALVPSPVDEADA